MVSWTGPVDCSSLTPVSETPSRAVGKVGDTGTSGRSRWSDVGVERKGRMH